MGRRVCVRRRAIFGGWRMLIGCRSSNYIVSTRASQLPVRGGLVGCDGRRGDEKGGVLGDVEYEECPCCSSIVASCHRSESFLSRRIPELQNQTVPPVEASSIFRGGTKNGRWTHLELDSPVAISDDPTREFNADSMLGIFLDYRKYASGRV